MNTWVDGAAGSLFDVDNLPYGVFSLPGEEPRVGVRIGDHVLDLAPVAAAEMLDVHHVFEEPTLNPLMAEGPQVAASIRQWITGLLTDETERGLVEPHLLPLDEVELHLPVEVADYVDFYCSLEHATNVGRIFRPDAEALLPNWRHLPVGYHGRAGTVVASGTDVVRPSGQRKPPDADAPTYGPSTRLDIEAELGFVVGSPSTARPRGSASTTSPSTSSGWSASTTGRPATSRRGSTCRLGPFLGKSFATSISHWVTPLAALDAAWVDLPGQDPEPLPYLQGAAARGLDIDVEVELNGEVVSRPPYASMYWSPAQMLAHMTVNGASLRTGDLFASGTISGAEREQRGSFLELSWGGKEPFGDGRTFLEDGDEVALRYTAPGTGGGRIALGEVSGRIQSARP